MNKKMFIIVLILTALFLLGCSESSEPEEGSRFKIGDSETVRAGSQTFTMYYVNDSTSMKFPFGPGDNTEKTLSKKFWMAETEVTNAAVAAVFQWAYDNKRFNTDSAGDPNYLNSSTAQHGGKELLDMDGSASFEECRINYSNGSTRHVTRVQVNSLLVIPIISKNMIYTGHPVILPAELLPIILTLMLVWL